MAENTGPLDAAVDAVTAFTDPGVARTPPKPDPLEDALALIGASLGHPARTPSPASEPLLAPVEATAAASSWMPWRVRLEGGWRQVLPGPLLVRLDGAPAAVLPGKRGATVLEGGSRSARTLNGTEAARVAPEAMAFAQDLPESTGWLALTRWALRGQRRNSLLFVLLAVVTGLGALVLPLTTSAVFNVAIPQGRAGLTVVLLSAFILVSAGLALLSLLRGYVLVRVRDGMDITLAPAVTARLLRIKAGFFGNRSVGDVANRATSVLRARQTVADWVVSLLAASLFGLVSVAYVFAAGVVLGLVVTATAAIVTALTVWAQLRVRALLPDLLERRSVADAMLLSILDTLVSWRVTGREHRALEQWAHLQGQSSWAMARRSSAQTLTGALTAAAPLAVLTTFVAASAAAPGSLLVPGSSSAPGVFLAVYAAVAQLTIAILAISGNLIALSSYGPLLERIDPIVTAPVEGGSSPVRPGRLRGRVSLQEVRFGYQRERAPLYENVTLEVQPGEFVALVGPSGSGKSTLMRLLLGFEEPWSGIVAFDGHDLAELDMPAVRRQIGTVLQSSRPLGRTVRECLRGPRELSDSALYELAERCALDSDLARMPQGLDSPVGEGGSMLSGGQRQRLMIAAALAADPPILLLDEATSALDNTTQAVVMRTITESTATRIVIAHRLSTVREADRVVVIADGSVAESGPPEELLKSGGLFARLAARQEL